MLAINTDTHAIEHFDNIAYGIDVARRSWIEPDDVLNAMKLKELCAWLGLMKE
jgi:DNA polymerase (family 10)